MMNCNLSFSSNCEMSHLNIPDTGDVDCGRGGGGRGGRQGSRGGGRGPGLVDVDHLAVGGAHRQHLRLLHDLLLLRLLLLLNDDLLSVRHLHYLRQMNNQFNFVLLLEKAISLKNRLFNWQGRHKGAPNSHT